MSPLHLLPTISSTLHPVSENTVIMNCVTVHTPAGLRPVTRFAMHTNRKKTRFGAAALGFSVTSAALHLQKTPRIGWCVNQWHLVKIKEQELL